MMRPVLRSLVWLLLFTVGLLYLGLMTGCASAPVIVNKATPVKAVNTEPIRKALTTTKAKTDTALESSWKLTKLLDDAEAKLPKQSPEAATVPLESVQLSVEQLIGIHGDFMKARTEIVTLRTNLVDANASTATALEQRAAVQEVADAQHEQNVILADAVNDSKAEIASLSRARDQASAKGSIYLRCLIGLGLLNLIYLFLKFYLHLPFL